LLQIITVTETTQKPMYKFKWLNTNKYSYMWLPYLLLPFHISTTVYTLLVYITVYHVDSQVSEMKDSF